MNKLNISPRRVIGMLGGKGCGKDTAAEFLVNELGYRRLAFADRLYQEVADAFGVSVAFLGDRTVVYVTGLGSRELKEAPRPELALSRCNDPDFAACVLADASPKALEDLGIKELTLDTPLSPRLVMQLWGTEYRRIRGVDSYWIDIVARQVQDNPNQSFVLTDVRFPNEHAFVKALPDGLCVRVRNHEVEQRNSADAHPSETAALKLPVDRELINEFGKLDKLRAAILAVAKTPLQEAAVA